MNDEHMRSLDHERQPQIHIPVPAILYYETSHRHRYTSADIMHYRTKLETV